MKQSSLFLIAAGFFGCMNGQVDYLTTDVGTEIYTDSELFQGDALGNKSEADLVIDEQTQASLDRYTVSLLKRLDRQSVSTIVAEFSEAIAAAAKDQSLVKTAQYEVEVDVSKNNAELEVPDSSLLGRAVDTLLQQKSGESETAALVEASPSDLPGEIEAEKPLLNEEPQNQDPFSGINVQASDGVTITNGGVETSTSLEFVEDQVEATALPNFKEQDIQAYQEAYDQGGLRADTTQQMHSDSSVAWHKKLAVLVKNNPRVVIAVIVVAGVAAGAYYYFKRKKRSKIS